MQTKQVIRHVGLWLGYVSGGVQSRAWYVVGLGHPDTGIDNVVLRHCFDCLLVCNLLIVYTADDFGTWCLVFAAAFESHHYITIGNTQAFESSSVKST